ncbi:SRPBCC family protein [Nocardioides stalactiti]|uniref:SRPBCC family protein n=1 Tax=Nocardioides stalactiti TaxID=2755356 RepID=UPI0028AAB4C7|nr:SRPBCC family protein [Nocardioides stalactiti]
MSGLTREVTMSIAAPPEKVWDLVSDVTRIGEFSPETFEAQWTHGATGPAVGARFKGHVKRNGVGPTYWSPCTVTKCVEPGSDGSGVFEFAVGLDGSAWTNWGYQLTPEGEGTRVTEYFRLEPKWFLRGYWMVLGTLRGRTNERGMRTTLTRMKEVLEG